MTHNTEIQHNHVESNASSLSQLLSNLDVNENTPEIPDTLPEHACAYCGVHEPDCVVLCKKTSKWFCNGSSGNSRESHIISHLAGAPTSEVVLHKDGPHEGMRLKCDVCGSTNVFQLGFVPAISDSFRLLCRTDCLQRSSNQSEWKAIIRERQFLPWLVKVPSEMSRVTARPISPSQIRQLERLWKKNPDATVDDLDRSRTTAHVNPVQLRYSGSVQYYRTFLPLVELEAAEERRLRESMIYPNVSVRWEVAFDGCHVAYFHKPQVDEGPEMHVMYGDELIIRKSNETIVEHSYVGNVIQIPDSDDDEIGVDVRDAAAIANSVSTFTIQFKFQSIPYARMKSAINKLWLHQSDLHQPYIYRRLLGCDQGDDDDDDDDEFSSTLPSNLSAPNLPELNISQVTAVETVLQQRLSLIQGPPGTGKTMTSASIVYNLVKIYGGKVLAVAPSNIAADHLCERISRTGVKVLRVYARVREGLPSPVSPLTLHEQALQVEGHEELRALQLRRLRLYRLDDASWKRYRKLQWEVEHKLLSAADVICCTCVTAGDRRLEDLDFHTVLVDESTQAMEPECLIPIMLGCRRIVLIGDHCQLGPVIKCRRAAKAGLGQSLFERFMLLGTHPIKLQIQYRMHPALSEFPNNVFYEGDLRNGVRAEDRQDIGTGFPWPSLDRPMFFYCTTNSQEEISANGISYLNRTETNMVETIINKLVEVGVRPKSIGVITPYEGQRSFLNYVLQSSIQMSYKEIEIASVNAFQGREKDYIIMSCVRANDNLGIGFLNDPRRLNVALTRARYGLIVVGDPKSLCKQPVWNELLHFYHDRNLLVQGPLESLTPYVLQSPKPSEPFTFKPNGLHRVST